MPDPSDTKLIYVTTSSEAEAMTIAKTLVESKLAACANILGSIKSIYWWEGKVDEGDEVALILKTTALSVPKLIEKINEIHSYDCPAIVALEVSDGNPGFLSWISDNVE